MDWITNMFLKLLRVNWKGMKSFCSNVSHAMADLLFRLSFGLGYDKNTLFFLVLVQFRDTCRNQLMLHTAPSHCGSILELESVQQLTCKIDQEHKEDLGVEPLTKTFQVGVSPGFVHCQRAGIAHVVQSHYLGCLNNNIKWLW